MDRWFLIAATLLAAVGGVWGMISVHRGKRSRWTVVWMAAVIALPDRVSLACAAKPGRPARWGIAGKSWCSWRGR